MRAQTFSSARLVVVDNSGRGAFRALDAPNSGLELIENRENVGFGSAINQGYRAAPADYLATLNDDAVAEPTWLEHLLDALERHPRAGMAAPRILISGAAGRLDSAGMLVARDGSSKQRGHGEPSSAWMDAGEALLPSGCAAMYRGAMLRDAGLFAEDFFLYCEDTDLGLRGQWAGWNCRYVPSAVVTHQYSRSAGAASARKAWFVERNRLRLAVRCFPARALAAVPFYAILRYLYHVAYLLDGKGKAAEFGRSGGGRLELVRIVCRAHMELLGSLPRLLAQRRDIRARRRISESEFRALMRRHEISVRQVAAL